LRKLFDRVKQALVARHLWDVFTYVLFGGLTTVVNIGVFALATKLGLAWTFANFWAWLLSVLFAFVTNKLWVFESHTENLLALSWEFAKFIVARLVSLALDYGCMFVFIEMIGWSNMIAKLLTQVVIIVVNYAFSKFIIFRDKPSDK
jgi:putative flippase GtrA